MDAVTLRSHSGIPISSCAFAASIVALWLSAATTAHAQGNAYAAPIGGRSALMGNTGIALGIDGAAPFLNPATIVRLDDQRFSFSVNFYNYSVTSLNGWHQPGPADMSQFGKVALSNTGLTSSGFGGLPSTLCLFFTLAKGSPSPDAEVGSLDSWRQKLAICLGTTESQGVAFSALPFNGVTSLGATSQSQSLVQSWSRLNIGPSYSVALSRRLAVGLSLHGVYTNESFILDSSSITASMANGGVQSSLGVANSGNSFDMSAILGAIYSPRPFTFGLSVTFPAIHAFGSYSGTTHDEYSSGTTGSATLTNASGTFSATPPIRIAVGAGVEWPNLTLELDESLNIPSPSGFEASVSGTTSTLSANKLGSTPFQSTFSVQEHTVLNSSVGAEYFIKNDFSLVGGFSLNLTALPALNPSAGLGNLVQERENIATVSAGVGTYAKSGNLLLGFQLGYGWGESLAANPYQTPNDLVAIDTRSYSALLILAGSTNLKSLGRAVEKIENVISGDKPSSSTDGPPAKASPPEAAPKVVPAKPPASKSPSPASEPKATPPKTPASELTVKPSADKPPSPEPSPPPAPQPSPTPAPEPTDRPGKPPQ